MRRERKEISIVLRGRDPFKLHRISRVGCGELIFCSFLNISRFECLGAHCAFSEEISDSMRK